MIYEIHAEKGRFALVNGGNSRWTVVCINRTDGRVLSAMPGDLHSDYGGQRYSILSDEGINYVSSWYSKGYAQQIFRSLTK